MSLLIMLTLIMFVIYRDLYMGLNSHLVPIFRAFLALLSVLVFSTTKLTCYSLYFIVVLILLISCYMWIYLCHLLVPVQIPERDHMQHCNPYKTPVKTESNLGHDGALISDPNLYRSLVGSL